MTSPTRFNRVDVDKEISAETRDNTRIVRDVSNLQNKIDDAATSATENNREVVHLVPAQTYDIDTRIDVKPYVTLQTHGGVLNATSDVDLLFLDTGARVFGARFYTRDITYSSSCLVADASIATNPPYDSRISTHFVAKGLEFDGDKGEGTAIRLSGESTMGGQLTHCVLQVDSIRGHNRGIHAETPASGSQGFINDIHIYMGTWDNCTTCIRHTGNAEAKLLVHSGHIQGSNCDRGIINDNPDGSAGGSVVFRGHVEDDSQMDKVVAGRRITVDEQTAFINLQPDSTGYYLGSGTTFGGYGFEKSSGGGPSGANWRVGAKVFYKDTGDGSDSGMYLSTTEFGMTQISADPPSGAVDYFSADTSGSGAGAPTTSDVADGDVIDWEDTDTGEETGVYKNDGGTIERLGDLYGAQNGAV